MERTALGVHIISGGLAIILGFVALFVAKGGRTHRLSGMGFFCAMVVMALLGGGLAIAVNRAPGTNAPVGLLTAYLVVTGLTAVRPVSPTSRLLHVALMGVASAAGLTLLGFGTMAYLSPSGKIYGMPFYPFLIFASIAAIAVAGDVGMLQANGVRVLRGAPRVARHLWRMGTALLIAAFSFFLGQAKVIPQPYRIFPLLMIPPLAVLVALLYWLWRVRFRQSLRGMIQVNGTGAAR